MLLADLLPFAFLGLELFVDFVDPAQTLGFGLQLFLIFGRLGQQPQTVLPGKPGVANSRAKGFGGAESINKLRLVGRL